MKQKIFRLPEKLADHIEKDAKEQKLSENDWGIQAFEHFLSCSKLDTSGPMKMIVLSYKDKCMKCGRDVDKAEWALWAKGKGVVCMDCYISRIGDKALVAKFLKNRELTRTKKALETECDRLATKLETLRLGDKVEELHTLSAEVHKKIEQYFQAKVGTPEEKDALEEILQTSRRQFQVQRDIETFIESTLKVKKWTKKAKEII